MKNIQLLLTAALACLATGTNAQVSNPAGEKLAAVKCDSAVALADRGQTSQAIRLLTEALVLDPQPVRYSAELAYTYYLQHNTSGAISLLDQLSHRPDADEKLYTFLGSLYSQNDEPAKALNVYRLGTQRFPESAVLCAALSAGLVRSRSYYAALESAEKGILADPAYAENYYWAALIYCHSTEKVWGMLYGEIYLCLNTGADSTHANQISRLLYQTSQTALQLSGEEGIKVNFSEIASGQGTGEINARLPYQVGIYEMLMLNAAKQETVVDLYTLDLIRTRFLKSYFEQDLNTPYPNALLEYQAEIANAGFFDEYNHWVFQSGNQKEFSDWAVRNDIRYAAFRTWLKENPLKIRRTHFFNSGQYAWKEKPEKIRIERRIQGVPEVR